MGKGGNNIIETIKTPSPSSEPSVLDVPTDTEAAKTFYTWEEIKKHNKRDDCWIVVNDYVYNMTSFKSKHPGGSKIIDFYAGQDATEVFNAFHKDFIRVNKYSKIYQIGKLNENINDIIVENEEEKNKILKEAEIKKDFKEIKKIAQDMNLFKPSFTFFFLNAFHIIFFNIMGYFLLLNYGNSSSWAVFFAFVCHLISQGQCSWTQHDYGHSSLFKNPKHNRLIHIMMMGLIKGASSDWWVYMHNLHHAKPNVINKDPDVRLEPIFVIGKVEAKKRAEKNVKKNIKNLYPYTIQQYLFPIAAPLLFPAFFQITTFRHAIKRAKYLDLIFMIPMYLIQFGIAYYVFGSIFKSFAYFITLRLFESAWFTWVSQCNHIVMDVHDDVSYDSWLNLQLKATCNIEKSWFNDWFTGHLNFQIEHHLFPTMPRHNLYKIQPLIQSLCKKHGISYVEKPLGRAFYDILTSLKKSGEMWQEAYDELILAM